MLVHLATGCYFTSWPVIHAQCQCSCFVCHFLSTRRNVPFSDTSSSSYVHMPPPPAPLPPVRRSQFLPPPGTLISGGGHVWRSSSSVGPQVPLHPTSCPSPFNVQVPVTEVQRLQAPASSSHLLQVSQILMRLKRQCIVDSICHEKRG